MQRSTPSLQLGFVRDFLNQRMAKHELPRSRTHLRLDQLGFAKSVKRLLEICIRILCYLLHDNSGKFSADYSSNLKKAFVFSADPINTCTDSCVNSRWQDFSGGGRSQFIVSGAATKLATFFKRIDQLFRKEWI